MIIVSTLMTNRFSNLADAEARALINTAYGERWVHEYACIENGECSSKYRLALVFIA